MEWLQLIDDTRLGMSQYPKRGGGVRSDFERDYDRMVFSSPFRRLQNKTQVFPLPGHVFVHNRLTHSLEVASVGRSLAREACSLLYDTHADSATREALGHIGEIVSAACLCHDIGNPPFGHSGEKTIASYFSEGPGLVLKDKLTERQWGDLTHFEGNANSFRVLTHQFCGRRKGGFAMTYSTLASIVKYPYSSLHAREGGKFGFFESEEEIWREVSGELGLPELRPGLFARHPLVYLLEAADDICYQVMDMEDAHKLKIMTTGSLKRLWMPFIPEERRGHVEEVLSELSDPNEQIAYLRSGVIGTLVSSSARVFAEREGEILRGELQGSLISNLPAPLKEAYDNLTATATEKIYNAPDVIDIEIAGNRIVTYLLDTLMDAVMQPEKTLSRLVLERIPKQYDVHAEGLYQRVQSVLDHVSAMTDVYALDLFRKLNGDSLPVV